MARRVLILGSNNALGRHLVSVFSARHWETIGCISADKTLPLSRVLVAERGLSPEARGKQLIEELMKVVHVGGRQHHLDAVVNVAAGFAPGTAASPDLLADTRAIAQSSLYSSMLAAHAASLALRPGGLLVLRGAAQAFGPTAWSLPYGAVNAAVHHLVGSLADPRASGLQPGVKTIGISPGVLDTPKNREVMPDADHGSWASLDEVAGQIESWCADPSDLQSGSVYVVRKTKHLPAEFEPHMSSKS
eukprot:gb/GFBE01045834.1/.p1 GENE.gb/GFBE01045834.1/~~gb/GFBE01045834.1/.p1  ORF type:complete len:247 (+),score=32.49 gb/GFBE01045834.1/:1-741(+)